jgi:YfiH family protein
MPITCPELAKLPHIRHGFFTRKGGTSTGLYASLNCGYGSGDDLDIVTENRKKIAAKLHVPVDSLCTAFQIHSPDVLVIDKPWLWEDAPEADALVTRTPGIALGILTADCLPVLFADTTRGIIGAAHAGWKGAIGGVLEATIDAMIRIGARPETITATIGPAIAQGSYEVGMEFHDRFIAHDPANTLYFIHGGRPDHFLFDLKAYAKDRLRNAGLSLINVLAPDTCLQENDFFSYRRATLRGEPVYGRQISAISLQD